MGRFTLAPAAQRDLEAIERYVEEAFGLDVAERVMTEIEAHLSLLAFQPAMGRVRKEWGEAPPGAEPYRFFPSGPSVIAYRPTPDGIDVLGIFRPDRRDFVKTLSAELDRRDRTFGPRR